MKDNKTIKRAIVKGLSNKDLSIFGNYYSEDYVLHTAGFGDVKGSANLRELFCRVLTGLSNVSFKLNDMLAESEKVASRWTITGTHTSLFLGAAPTNKLITISGMVIDRFRNERAIESWQVIDMKSLEAQLGINLSKKL
ncbi:MAG: ester cyclase [Gammaproteobacteria bacterium]|nr:ester cyclase [Gammaproteobacteria bacterium]